GGVGRELDAADGNAAGEERQEAAERVADAAAGGAKPSQPAFAAGDAFGRVRSADPGVVDVAFDTPHPDSGLYVVPDGEAGEGALHADVDRSGGIGDAGMAPAVAAVDTGIEPRPAEDRSDIERRLVRRRR